MIGPNKPSPLTLERQSARQEGSHNTVEHTALIGHGGDGEVPASKGLAKRAVVLNGEVNYALHASRIGGARDCYTGWEVRASN